MSKRLNLHIKDRSVFSGPVEYKANIHIINILVNFYLPIIVVNLQTKSKIHDMPYLNSNPTNEVS